MDYKEQEENISSLEFDKGKTRNDYKFLVQKLKTIKENINLLDKIVFKERNLDFEK